MPEKPKLRVVGGTEFTPPKRRKAEVPVEDGWRERHRRETAAIVDPGLGRVGALLKDPRLTVGELDTLFKFVYRLSLTLGEMTHPGMIDPNRERPEPPTTGGAA